MNVWRCYSEVKGVYPHWYSPLPVARQETVI
nr:MAG TPA: hypothetical protein [Caudoviricetes sp.]